MKTRIRLHGRSHCRSLYNMNNKDESTSSEKSESPINRSVTDDGAKVEKGLTHIKYNKFAPLPDEAAAMTDEEFRKVIYQRMKEDERIRREAGLVGGATSDNYIDNLSRKTTPTEETASTIPKKTNHSPFKPTRKGIPEEPK